MEAVSYTHLDVYKRQALARAGDAVDLGDHAGGVGGEHALLRQRQHFAVALAVSYTHLVVRAGLEVEALGLPRSRVEVAVIRAGRVVLVIDGEYAAARLVLLGDDVAGRGGGGEPVGVARAIAEMCIRDRKGRCSTSRRCSWPWWRSAFP